jgi:hypothetical protein
MTTSSQSSQSYSRSADMSQRSSFVSLAEQLTALNQNTVEIVTKLNDIVTSQDSAVSIILLDQNGNKSEYYMPTVGYLKNEIDKINTNIKRLSGIDSTSNIIDGKSVKRIYVTDMNKEPYPLGSLSEIKQFEPINNHFFESLMNPLLSVNIDLSDKVTTDVNKIISRRYIMKFERESDLSLTTDGLKSYNSFQDKFLNRTDVDINEFTEWYNTNIEIGILRDTVEPYDEQIYELSINEVNYHGLFSVIKTETDTLNRKFWYHLNTLTYYTKDGADVTLSIGDSLSLNRLNSNSRWEVKEINREASNYRVGLERVEGYDPVPIGTNVLRFFSDTTHQKKVKINVGFDEFCVLFVKPVNTESNVVSTVWSKGLCFYSNDLTLTTDENTDLSQYYLRYVYDYGKLLKDMVLKKIPTEYGDKPNKPTLDTDNFKVVQINKHLTDTENTRTLRNLHSQKITAKARISQINSAIVVKNKEMNVKNFTSVSEYNTARNEVTKLISEQERETKTLSSVVSQIGTKKTENKESPKFRLRGFWNMPSPIFNGKTEPQYVVQFRIQYRYSAKTGEINPTEGYKLKANSNTEVATPDGRVGIETNGTSSTTTTTTTPSGGGGGVVGGAAAILKGNLKTSVVSTEQANVAKTSDKTAYFSNWNEMITDVRKRYWDSESGTWYWKIEDVEDADTPNINQIDIPINPNEKLEIRIKSISEVGWPDSLIESDWSEILTVEFPDDLDNVLNENDFILKEAEQDQVLVSVDNNLIARGVYTHIQDSFYLNETYYAHSDKNLQVSFKDENGNFLNLYDYLKYLTDKISDLEYQISQATGELGVYLHTPTTIRKIKDKETINITVELEDYATEGSGTTSREYWNYITLIDDYKLEIANISETSSLSLLSHRTYTSTGTTIENTFYKYEGSKALIVDYNNDLYTQFDYQYLWFSDNAEGSRIYSGTTAGDANSVLGSVNYNIGTSSLSSDFYDPIFNVINGLQWSGTGVGTELYATVHPRVYNSSDLVETGQAKEKSISANTNNIFNIHIYFKLDGHSTDDSFYKVPGPGSTPDIRYRWVKCFLETENSTTPFEFGVKFKLRQFRENVYTVIGTASGTGAES